MKKSRFTDSQISEALKRVEAGLAVPEICQELAVENARLKKIYAEGRLPSERVVISP